MKSYVLDRSVALPAACAPVAASRVVPAAVAAWLSQAHQAFLPAQPGKALPTVESEGTTGFAGMGIRIRNKQTDVRGVPPRGRPI